ncbi:MAG TPA: POTRA domain-containing protein [Candidatus Binatia bacterium]|nr:POTRA domain-containing protein [Candidatus Binatia bacterium]
MVYPLRRAGRVVVALLLLISLAMPAMSADVTPKIVSVSVSGNAHVPTERILAVVKAKVGDPFDPKVVQDDLQAIFALGYFADQVPPLIDQRPDGIAVTYRVIENPVITAIRFDGNAHVPSDTLLALMDTSVGAVFNTNTFHEDVLKINSYYDKVGYGGQLPTHVADINIDPQSGALTLKIQEGLTVRNIIITPPPVGDPVLSAKVILNAITLKPGQPYSELARDKDIEALKNLYDKSDLQLGDFEGGIDPASVDLKNLTADVRYTISAARVGAVQITGNFKTHDDVVRRQLRTRPGDLVRPSNLRNDYNRLNNTGFFSKVDLIPKTGPDPKRPAYVTLDWNVAEQRTGVAELGGGYSGGLTGQGLTAHLSYSENNINGTGNGASVRLEGGSRLVNIQLSGSMPYLGNSLRAQKYSLGATVFLTSQTNLYPIYAVPSASPNPNGPAPTPLPANNPQLVTLVPLDPNNINQVANQVSNYFSRSNGIAVTLGRRLSDPVKFSIGANIQQVSSAVTLPSGFAFNSSQVPVGTNASTLPQFTFSNSVSGAIALGVNAPSIANVNSTAPFALHSVVFALAADTRDDVFSPRRGVLSSLTDEISGPWMGSDFKYTLTTLDIAKYFPVMKNSTFAVHAQFGTSTGAIPTNRLYTYSDQQLRGYNTVFYGTDARLFQAELRVPISPDRHIAFATFFDDGATRIRGAAPTYDSQGNLIANLSNFQWHPDAGVGVRFDIPQIGIRTIRLDYAKGSTGTHFSFGIGQSF